MTRQKKKKTALWILLPLLVILLAAAGFLIWKVVVYVPEPDTDGLIGPLALPSPEPMPETPAGQMLYEALQKHWRASLSEGVQWEKRNAARELTVRSLDRKLLADGLDRELYQALERRVAAAVRGSEIYDENQQYRPEVLQAAFEEVLSARLQEAEPYYENRVTTLYFRYENRHWSLENRDRLDALLRAATEDLDSAGESLREAAMAGAAYIPKHYVIEENALTAPAPDESAYGVTDDPAVLSALLETPMARQLIGDQELTWNPEIQRIPGTPIRYYLDETLLAIVWQEREARGIGTISEIFIADGSQLRRRIAGDEPYSFDFLTTSDFARSSNAVLASGGDFYHHARACGICVYQRQIIRFEPNSCDSCFFTTDGDMLFSYRGQFETQEEVQRFLEENDVVFSLGFGPVLIDDGVDVTPDFYAWGEILDEYARSGLGMLGKHHYLKVDINCGRPGTEYYYLATLRQLTDAMAKRGCVKAYTLDGGQTATTVFHNELINPVQFGWEKAISDVIYFASAVPEG